MAVKKRGAKKKTAAKKKGAAKKPAASSKKKTAKKKKPSAAKRKAASARNVRASAKASSSAGRTSKRGAVRKAQPRRSVGGLSAAADVPVRALSPSRTVLRVGIQREDGFVYFVDPGDMNIWRFPESVEDDVRMAEERELVFDTGLGVDPAFADERVLYYVDKDGHVAVTDVVRA